MPATRSRHHDRVRAEQRRFRRAQEGNVWQARELPRHYYLDHFARFLDEVGAAHRDLLGDDDGDFLDRFGALPFNARCAFVRLANRRGYVFDLEKLDYPEIEALPDAWSTLAGDGFTETISAALLPEWFERLTRPELVRVLDEADDTIDFKRSSKKAELVRVALEALDPDTLRVPARFVAQGRRDVLNYLLYLYFGRIEDNLQAFTLHDLGLAERPEAIDEPAVRFETPGHARIAFFYAKAVHDVRHGSDTDATRLVGTRDAWPAPACDASTAHRERLLEKLGGRAERLGATEEALALYADCASPHCNERTVRLRHARDDDGDRDWARSRLETMIDDPASDEELVFAEDFYARKYRRKRTSAMTDLIRSAATITVDDAYRQQPERAALHHYEARGIEAWRMENAPWRVLFVLLFRDELFGVEDPGWRMPASLRAGNFLERHAASIETKLAALDDPAGVMADLEACLAAHVDGADTSDDVDDVTGPEASGDTGGRGGFDDVGSSEGSDGTNGLANADGSEAPDDIGGTDGSSGAGDDPIALRGERALEPIGALLTLAPGGAVAHMLRLMARDWKGTRDGFPDLMLVEDGALRFVEIKAEGDSLRRNQLTRLHQLRAAGFAADIVRVDYAVDPDQTWVVVDVETTGRSPGLHRVTEIGAVKLRGDRIVDEFRTFVNPGRPIPSAITRLTGIDDAMVADAPPFADVADAFEAFMGEAIFVAHNVNFDYGFLSAEYAMIDRAFRHPKLCTCASMRRHHPGQDSYSLGRLCRAFDIPLENHHRALDDARAAAGLLGLVNARRLAG